MIFGLLALAAGETLVAWFAGAATIIGAVKLALDTVSTYRALQSSPTDETDS